MVTEREIDIAVRVLLRRHGDGASDHAKRMLRRYSKSDDTERAESWRRIVDAIKSADLELDEKIAG